MYLYFCSLCLNNNKHLKSVLIEDDDGIVVETKIKNCLVEIIDIKPEVPKYICNKCLNNINCYYKFKQNCLRNNALLNDYFRNLAITNESYEHLSVKFTDIISQTSGNAPVLPVQVSDIESEKDSPKNSEEVTPVPSYDFEFVNCIKSEPIHEPEISISNVDVPEMSVEAKSSAEVKVTVQSKIKKHTFKLFKCTICDREFVHQNSLKYHLKTHADIKNFECSICSKKFRCKSHLVQHENSHTGVKDFKCTVCGKSFSYKCSMISHRKTHDGIKNFECTVCRKKFVHKVHLTQHVKIHSEKKDFECSVCHKQFISKGHMLRHRRIHNSIKYSEFVHRNNIAIPNGIKNE